MPKDILPILLEPLEMSIQWPLSPTLGLPPFCLNFIAATSLVMGTHAVEGAAKHAKPMTQKNIEAVFGIDARLPQTPKLQHAKSHDKARANR